jgi:hypothetical protein
MQVQTQETRIIITIETIQTSRRKLNRQRATKIYEIPEIILHIRIAGRSSYSDIQLVI